MTDDQLLALCDILAAECGGQRERLEITEQRIRDLREVVSARKAGARIEKELVGRRFDSSEFAYRASCAKRKVHA